VRAERRTGVSTCSSNAHETEDAACAVSRWYSCYYSTTCAVDTNRRLRHAFCAGYLLPDQGFTRPADMNNVAAVVAHSLPLLGCTPLDVPFHIITPTAEHAHVG
jgi:hypothetical protein